MTCAIEEKSYSQRRACGLIGLAPKTYLYASQRSDDVKIRERLKIQAGQPRRFSATLSGMASASMRFSLAFSSSSARSRLAADTSVPP